MSDSARPCLAPPASKQPYVSSKQPYVSSKQPYVSSKQPHLAGVAVRLLLLALMAGVTACEVGDLDSGPGDGIDLDVAGAPANSLRITRDTFFKISTAQSSQLQWGSEKCRLFAGDTVELRGAPTPVGDHLEVEIVTPINGCEFTIGYLFADHVAGVGGTPSGLCQANISVRECALLSTIAYAEGTDRRYDITFGYHTFTSYADHPRLLVCSGGYCSDAAGRYQFLSTTWDWAARNVGARDFSPASQDLAALFLIRSRGVTWANQIDTYDEFVTAMYSLNREWASLPGSPYGQPTHSASSLWAQYRAFAGL